MAAPERRVRGLSAPDQRRHEAARRRRHRDLLRAAACIIADEPTTSLDVTIQAQYLRLLREIQEETSLALIFITHDFGIVAKMCDRVMVMYAGRVVESGPVRDIFNHPSHPYTQALLRSVPRMDEDVERLYSIDGPAARALGPARGVPVRAALPVRRRPLPARVSARRSPSARRATHADVLAAAEAA